MPETRQRLVAPQQLDALEEPRRHRRARHGDSDRLERLPRLLAEPLRQVSERLLDRLRRERLEIREGLLGGREHSGVQRCCVVSLPTLEEEPRELRELPQTLDLLLDERRGGAD